MTTAGFPGSQRGKTPGLRAAQSAGEQGCVEEGKWRDLESGKGNKGPTSAPKSRSLWLADLHLP